jgi:hypothetical protein
MLCRQKLKSGCVGHKAVTTAPVIAGLAVGIAVIILFSSFKIPGGVTDTSNVLITMERTPCFGTCPSYSLTIYGNGTVRYEGFMFVAVTGVRTDQIAEEKIQELVQEFYRIGYFSLQDRYEDPSTDLPSTTTSIVVAGMKKSVYRYGFGPEKLIQLENKIDEIAETERWIKGPGIVPADLSIRYSYGYGGTYLLDTANNSFTVAMCDGSTRQHVTLALPQEELQTIWRSVQDSDFFVLPDLTEECPPLTSCVDIFPEYRSTLQITADSRTNEVEFRQNYELNHHVGPGSDLYKFKDITGTIQSVLSEHQLPVSDCRYA